MTNPFKPSVAQQTALVDHLVKAVVSDATGEAQGDFCLGEPPSARYFMETLGPHSVEPGGAAPRNGRTTPDSLGFEFEAENASSITVKARASFYYAVLPTRTQQLEWAGVREEPYRLAPLFRRLDVSVGPVEVVLGNAAGLRKALQREFQHEFDRAVGVALRDPRIDRRVGSDRRERLVPPAAMTDDDAFEGWLAQKVGGTPVAPAPAAHVVVTSRPVAPGRLRVTVTLQNLARDPVVTVQGRGPNAGRTRRDETRDHTLFRAGLEVGGDRLLPITMDLGADAYRYQRELGAYANNCGVRVVTHEGQLVTVRSVAAPEHDTYHAVARVDERWGYEVLASDPLPVLDDLADEMEAYLETPVWGTTDLQDQPELARRKEADRQAAALEVARFRDGISWLRRDRRLLTAFQLANESMVELNRPQTQPSKGWRLFQLVAIVSQLGALAWREHPPELFTPGLWGDEEDVDPTEAATVVWYPTGGGKTEAYLGLVLVCMFYDRARGKRIGVSAWCRFPLRLLTLQQTQRQLDVIAAAETVRDQNADRLREVGGDPGWPFFIGFYAGGGNTPNSLTSDRMLDRLRTSEEERNAYRLVHDCPYCRERSVRIPAPDPQQLRLKHVCGNEQCGKVLPIVVVDTEIYRYLPTVVVGTLDKLANIGLSDKFGALFGDVDCRCPHHGFGRGGKCHERHAPGHPKTPPEPLGTPLYDPSPTLEIIDELHMVNEELGAFSGHYEGLLAEVQRTLSSRQREDGRRIRMKVVATTATIRGEDRQSEHLFGLRSVVVPLPGPSLEESFYWRLDRDLPLRRFVGVMPTRGTAEMTLVRILTSAHRALWKLDRRQDLPPTLAAWPEEELSTLVNLYRTSLTYTGSLVDFGRIRRSLDTQVNETLRREGFPDLGVAELKGSTRLDEVRGVLDDLDDAHGDTGMVVATSMVSHGVDVDRLNVMLFYGMPRSMAEYIQASSRVGRKYHGLVFMLFNPVRERDRSHYRYHGKFHEYLDRMVEPVAINRWSRFAVRRTLPGILMGHLLQITNHDWWRAGNAPGHLHDLSKMQAAMRNPAGGGLEGVQLTRLLEALHAVFQSQRPEGEELRSDLEDMVEHALASLRSAGASASLAGGNSRGYRATGDYLGLEYRPMTSLRDVSDGIPFHIVADGRRS
ncbi:helicase-like protein [Streptomyces sp. Amel2xB2]|uniref:helicase-related protein n=1 Tax=Streptomyces sp. Amel2xB2 TaxID=1305829 RepID=UPI000DB9FD2F|nr:helicase-related protein [Streptomyces sp. Amel2xB2]RAJ61666.1 helicase-like protein [Streptomyces sp. Amel2xB2]